MLSASELERKFPKLQSPFLFIYEAGLLKGNYRRSGSNRHSLRNAILSRARLPIPPRRLLVNKVEKSGFLAIKKSTQGREI